MKRVARYTILGAIAATTAFACGPWLSEAFLSSARNLLNIPETYLHFSFRAIRHQPEPPRPLKAAATATKFWEHPLPSTLEVDVEDLRRALAHSVVPEGERAGLLKAYENLRWEQLAHWEDAEMRSLPRSMTGEPTVINAPPWIARHDWPAAIPAEFQLYAEGVQLLNEHDHAAAHEKWQSLLKLPLEQRRQRSTWAAWMLMKTAASNDDMTHWLHEVCRIVEEEACEDSLRMHPAALALLSSGQDDPASVQRLALQYLNAKANERQVYLDAMTEAALAVAQSDDEDLRAEAAKNPATREIITSVLIHQVDDIVGNVDAPWNAPKKDDPNVAMLTQWSQDLTSAGVQNDSELGSFGIALYRIRKFDLSRQFLALGPVTWETLWIRGKLDLQRGQTREAAQTMAHALRLFPAEERKHILSVTESFRDRYETVERMEDDWFHGVRNSRFLAECATLKLSQSDFSSALKLFLDADCPHDTAYVAEHLMNPDELLAFIRKNGLKMSTPKPAAEKPEDQVPSPPEFGWRSNMSNTDAFLYLVGRQLARAYRFHEARPFYPPQILPFFDRFVALLRRGHSGAVKPEIRAQCLMEAARWHRWAGMELFGAETDPDGSIWEGEFPYRPISERRGKLSQGFEYFAGMENDRWVTEYRKFTELRNLCSPEEVRRLKSSQLWNKPRFQYRYEALQLAREAAHLLPNDSEEAAMMLAEGGTWIEPNEKGTDPFFEELISRYRKTAFAQKCDQLRWLPKEFVQQRETTWDLKAALAATIPGDRPTD